MKALTTFALIFVFAFLTYAQTETSTETAIEPRSESASIYGRGWDGQMIEVEGVVGDTPKLQVEKGGKTRSYSFRLFPSEDFKRGDEFVQVTYYTVRNGKKVGEFSAVKGDKVTITGLYSETKDIRKNGKVGSIAVNSKKK